MSDEHSTSRRTLAEKLNHLFATVHPRGRGEYTLEEVAEEITRRQGVSISHTYIWQLRTGRRTNPSMNVLEALADFFGVKPSYFFDDEAAARIDAQLELLTAMRDASVRRIAVRAADLSPESLRSLTDLIERWRQLEGLPNGGGKGDRPSSGQQTEDDR